MLWESVRDFSAAAAAASVDLPAAQQSSHKGVPGLTTVVFQVSTFNEHGATRQPSQLEHHLQHEHQLSPHIGFGGTNYLHGFLGLSRSQCGYRTSASAANQGRRAWDLMPDGDEERIRPQQ